MGWFSAFKEFGDDMFRHWVGKMTGLLSVLLAVIPLTIPVWFAGDAGLWHTRWLWWGASVVSFFIASRLAWDEQRKKRRDAENRVDVLKPQLGFSANSEGFHLVHLGGQAARFIEIGPITNEIGSRVSFDSIDFIEIGTKRSISFRLETFHPSGSLPIPVTQMDKIIFIMCNRWGNGEDKHFPITIRFRWNRDQLEEKFVLKWIANERRFETKPLTL